MKFTEEKLERAFIELLEKQNFPHCRGNAIVRAADEVLIEADLLRSGADMQQKFKRGVSVQPIINTLHLCWCLLKSSPPLSF